MASDPYLASVSAFASTFTIEGWAMCLGQLQAISDNTALYSLVGTVYGGDGRTSYGLPDLRGRSPVGQGSMPGGLDYRQGYRMGSERTSLSLNQLPEHSHSAVFTPSGGGSEVTGTLQVATNGATASTPTTETYLAANPSPSYYKPAFGGVDLVEIPGLTVSGGGGGGGTVTVEDTGMSQSFSILNPVLPMNWQISTAGLYPRRA